MRLVPSSLLILLTLGLAACGINGDYDIGKELQPVTPIREGIYADESKKPMPVTLRGSTYFVETKNQNGGKDTIVAHFYRIPEFDGYIMQLAIPHEHKYLYFYTRVTNTRLEILDEDIEHAVLPPHLAALFVFENPESEKPVRTSQLKSGRDILVILRALAGAKYPMKSFGVLKRVS